MPKIVLENLTKSYNDNTSILHGINLSMEDNEFTVLVGPSGCGKSTTLRMIAGLESVTDGEIYIDAKPVTHLQPKERNLAMVFQDYALYPHMNVAQNISFALRLQKRPQQEIESTVRKVADIVGLSDLLQRKPAALSGGQRQRVAMARALAKDSGIFLFDEPLSNLDAKLRTQMRAELAILRQRVKKNMIYVTHDQIEAMTLADRIVIMNEGYIQQEGTPEQLFKKPANRFVAGFIGSPPMNFLLATLVQEGDAFFAQGKSFKLRLPAVSSDALRQHNSAEVEIGIRPSDLNHDSNALEDQMLKLKVVVSEYIGAQSVLLCHCGEEPIRVELKSDIHISIGSELVFAVDSHAIHVFDRQTGRAIS